MAVDSGGHDGVAWQTCAFCPREIPYRTWTPLQGHSGEDVSQGTFLELSHSDSASFVSRLFELVRENDQWQVVRVRLDGSRESYSYGNPRIPDFGFGIDQVFAVCESCFGLLQEDLEKVRDTLGRKTRHFDEVVGRILAMA